jgi:hypothetical protein
MELQTRAILSLDEFPYALEAQYFGSEGNRLPLTNNDLCCVSLQGGQCDIPLDEIFPGSLYSHTACIIHFSSSLVLSTFIQQLCESVLCNMQLMQLCLSFLGLGGLSREPSFTLNPNNKLVNNQNGNNHGDFDFVARNLKT